MAYANDPQVSCISRNTWVSEYVDNEEFSLMKQRTLYPTVDIPAPPRWYVES